MLFINNIYHENIKNLTFNSNSFVFFLDFINQSIKELCLSYAKAKARKNVEEGRGVNIGGILNRSTTYEFSTSNPLWRASLEILDFMPLSTVDYSGGMIVTDWYSENNNDKEAIKILSVFYQMK